jgi:hypothetical protein
LRQSRFARPGRPGDTDHDPARLAIQEVAGLADDHTTCVGGLYGHDADPTTVP